MIHIKIELEAMNETWRISQIAGSEWSWGRLSWMWNRYNFTVGSMTEEADGFLTTEMGWSDNVGPHDAWRPNVLCGLCVASRKNIPQASDEAAADGECRLGDTIGNRECPTSHSYSHSV